MHRLTVRLLAIHAVLLLVACGDDSNHAPGLVPPGDVVVAAGDDVSVPLSASDPDGDRVSLSLVTAPDAAEIVDSAVQWATTAGDVGTHAVVVVATDAGEPSLSTYATFSITVRSGSGVNHPPELVPPADAVLIVGETLALSLVATDPDADGFSFALLAAPATANLAGNQLTWAPAAGDLGSHPFVVVVTDDGTPPLSAHAAFTVTVTGPDQTNLPPVFFGLPAPGAAEPCTPFSASFEALDPEDGTVTYSSPNLPAGATLTPTGTTVTLDWTPDQSQVGTHAIAVYATDDGQPAMSHGVVYMLDVAALPAMTLDPPRSTSVVGGTQLDLSVPHTPHACFTLTASGLPAGATWDAATTTLTWQTSADDFGVYAVTFTMTDSASPPASLSKHAQIVVQFREDFDEYTGWLEHEVYWPGYEGPVTEAVVADAEAADGWALQTSSANGDDVLGWSYRSFSGSQLPILSVGYELVARDVVVGPACGSGGNLMLYDFEVTDPTAVWVDWYDVPTPLVVSSVPDVTYGTNTDTVASSGSQALTVALQHNDSSNQCTVDIFWDSVLVTPLCDDRFEPNDDAAGATVVETSVVEPSLSLCPGDRDLFELDVIEGSDATVTIGRAAPSVAIAVYLIPDSGDPAAAMSSVQGGADETSVTLAEDGLTAGRYYVLVESQAVAAEPYDLQVDIVEP